MTHLHANGHRSTAWQPVPELAELSRRRGRRLPGCGCHRRWPVGGRRRAGRRGIYAYRDRCPSCTGTLAGRATDDGAVLRCPSCGAGFDARPRRCRRRWRQSSGSDTCAGARRCAVDGRAARGGVMDGMAAYRRAGSHPRQPRGARGSRVNAARCARRHIADEHQHVVNLEGRQLMCVCRGCYLLFTDTEAELRFRAVPDRYLAFPDFALDRRPVGGAADPGRAGVLLPQLGAWPHGGVLPRPGGRHRIRAGSAGVERHPHRRPRADTIAARHRGTARYGCPTMKPRLRMPIWSRSMPATSSSAGCA